MHPSTQLLLQSSFSTGWAQVLWHPLLPHSEKISLPATKTSNRYYYNLIYGFVLFKLRELQFDLDERRDPLRAASAHHHSTDSNRQIFRILNIPSLELPGKDDYLKRWTGVNEIRIWTVGYMACVLFDFVLEEETGSPVCGWILRMPLDG